MNNQWKQWVRSVLVMTLTIVMVVTSIPLSVQAASNADTIFTFLKEELGLNTAAACGVLANIEMESHFKPNTYGDHGTSYGICQWHNSRFTALRNWCNANGYHYTSLEGQLQYLKFELSTNNSNYLANGKKVYQKLLAVPNTAGGAYNAAYDWCYYYEVPANKQTKAVQRGKLAKSTYWPKYSAPEPEITQTEHCRYTLTIARKAGDIPLFSTATTYVEAENFFRVTSKKLTIPCDQKVVLSDGSTRYRFVDNQGEQRYITYKSKKMTVKQTHLWGPWVVSKIPTCSKSGSHTRTCACGKTETSKIKKLPHNYVSTSCTKRKSCVECGKISSDPPSHTYSNNCDTTCNLCDHIRKVGKHTWKNGYCSSCRLPSPTKVTVTAQPKSATVNRNTVADTTVKATGQRLKYTWYVKDVGSKEFSVSSQRTNTYRIKISRATNGRKVYCVVSDTYGNRVTTKTVTLKTDTISVSKCKVGLYATAFTYNGKVRKPSVTVKDAKGNTLKKGTDYTVTYAGNCKSVGTYQVTVKMKGYYTGTKILTFKINPIKTTVKSLTAGKKSLTVAIAKKSTQVAGYQIQYSTSKKFTNAKTKWLTSYKKTSLTLSGLSAKKTYYVRVRTYKKVGDKLYYSGWSTIKYKKTK